MEATNDIVLESTAKYDRVESPKQQLPPSTRKEDEEGDKTPFCYICLDTSSGEENSPDELLAPCSCMTHVHRKCLDHWRATSFTYNCMTHCPTCQEPYEFEPIEGESPEEIKKQINRARWGRALLVLLVILFGIMIIALIDAGTPKFFGLHWNALDGQIYNWIGLTSVPRFVIYFLLSLAMTVLITCLVLAIRWCWRCRRNGVRAGGVYRRADHRAIDADDNTYASVCWCNVSICDCSSSDYGEYAIIMVVVVAICAVLAGIVLIFVALVGGVGSVVDRKGEQRIRTLQVQEKRVKNLRHLSAV
ncbi:hypothetical protein AeMF1_009534 [Aphanomyces euteiches]|nr:hypothetical protein AeMF1_009534 [Aphanomyces euteiches]KAH9185963.1 hypothetical protein AeNC1_012060 [Aphanomyces euteiches]